MFSRHPRSLITSTVEEFINNFLSLVGERNLICLFLDIICVGLWKRVTNYPSHVWSHLSGSHEVQKPKYL